MATMTHSDEKHDNFHHERKAPDGDYGVSTPLEQEDLAVTHVGEHGTKRDLPPRVISMIAVAGTIGTGIFLGSGSALATGGPVGMWLAHTFIGIAVGMMMTSLGEMSRFAPNIGGFIEMGARYVDNSFGFMMGINYILQVAFGIPTDRAAIAVLFTYWDPNLNHGAAYITCFLVVTVLINIMGVKDFGEIEFFFACVKVSALVGLILFGLIADLGGVLTKREYIGGRYWRNEPFNDNFRGVKPIGLSRFLGFWSVFTKAAIAYSTTEAVGIMAGEAHNPRVCIKKAIKTVFYRIVGIYCTATLIIGLTVSQYSPELLRAVKEGSGTAGASPFVVLCTQMGVKGLSHIINAVVVTSALSSGNEQMYACSRALVAMVRNGQVPKVFLKTSKQGTPWAGVAVAGLVGCLGFLSVSSGSNQAFIWLSNLSSLSTLVAWRSICVGYYRFHKAVKLQAIDHTKFVLRGYLQPGLAIFWVFFFGIILIFNGYVAFMPSFSVSDFFAAYATIPVIILSYVIWKPVKKTKLIPLDEIDLSGGPAEALVGTRYDPAFRPNSVA